MALVRNFNRGNIQRNSIHDEIAATYHTFERDGRIVLQLDTFARKSREMPGKKSQTLQFDQVGAAALFQILKDEFGFR